MATVEFSTIYGRQSFGICKQLHWEISKCLGAKDDYNGNWYRNASRLFEAVMSQIVMFGMAHGTKSWLLCVESIKMLDCILYYYALRCIRQECPVIFSPEEVRKSFTKVFELFEFLDVFEDYQTIITRCFQYIKSIGIYLKEPIEGGPQTTFDSPDNIKIIGKFASLLECQTHDEMIDGMENCMKNLIKCTADGKRCFHKYGTHLTPRIIFAMLNYMYMAVKSKLFIPPRPYPFTDVYKVKLLTLQENTTLLCDQFFNLIGLINVSTVRQRPRIFKEYYELFHAMLKTPTKLMYPNADFIERLKQYKEYKSTVNDGFCCECNTILDKPEFALLDSCEHYICVTCLIPNLFVTGACPKCNKTVKNWFSFRNFS